MEESRNIPLVTGSEATTLLTTWLGMGIVQPSKVLGVNICFMLIVRIEIFPWVKVTPLAGGCDGIGGWFKLN